MRFIGSKENLIFFIERVIQETGVKGSTFFDIFSGTTKVSQYFKRQGYSIISNDNLYFSYILQKTYIENNTIPKFLLLTKWLKQKNIYDFSKTEIENIINFLNSVKEIEGYVFENYAPLGICKRMYLSNENAKKIDSILKSISLWNQNNLISDYRANYIKNCINRSNSFYF